MAKHEIGNLEFTSDVARAIHVSDVIIISVNTPPVNVKTQRLGVLVDSNAVAGSANTIQPILGVPTDMQAFFSVVDAIAAHSPKTLDSHKIIVEKSTVPIGTAH